MTIRLARIVLSSLADDSRSCSIALLVYRGKKLSKYLLELGAKPNAKANDASTAMDHWLSHLPHEDEDMNALFSRHQVSRSGVTAWRLRSSEPCSRLLLTSELLARSPLAKSGDFRNALADDCDFGDE
jgi:hypothetical protein